MLKSTIFALKGLLHNILKIYITSLDANVFGSWPLKFISIYNYFNISINNMFKTFGFILKNNHAKTKCHIIFDYISQNYVVSKLLVNITTNFNWYQKIIIKSLLVGRIKYNEMRLIVLIDHASIYKIIWKYIKIGMVAKDRFIFFLSNIDNLEDNTGVKNYIFLISGKKFFLGYFGYIVYTYYNNCYLLIFNIFHELYFCYIKSYQYINLISSENKYL